MDCPDWYPTWRHDAVHELQGKNAKLDAEFRLGQWPRWDYDIEAGTLIFSDQGAPKVVAEIQIVGSTSARANNWLWSWANSHWPRERTTHAERVRAFGEEHGIAELTEDFVAGDDDLNSLGWELSAVMARVTTALGVYRPGRDEGGSLFLTYTRIGWAS